MQCIIINTSVYIMAESIKIEEVYLYSNFKKRVNLFFSDWEFRRIFFNIGIHTSQKRMSGQYLISFGCLEIDLLDVDSRYAKAKKIRLRSKFSFGVQLSEYRSQWVASF